MPSVVWFPLAILLLGLGEQAIMFVVVLGAAPSIANGVLTGVDQVPPAYHKLGDVLGAKGWTLYRHIIIPAALPSYVAGLSQGWAFAWRSLMAGELLVVIPGAIALGNRLSYAQEFGDATGLMAYMIVILIVGMLADTAFSAMSRRIRRRRGPPPRRNPAPDRTPRSRGSAAPGGASTRVPGVYAGDSDEEPHMIGCPQPQAASPALPSVSCCWSRGSSSAGCGRGCSASWARCS